MPPSASEAFPRHHLQQQALLGLSGLDRRTRTRPPFCSAAAEETDSFPPGLRSLWQGWQRSSQYRLNIAFKDHGLRAGAQHPSNGRAAKCRMNVQHISEVTTGHKLWLRCFRSSYGLHSQILCSATLFAADAPATDGWRPLFDGKSLSGWKESDFFGAGKVTARTAPSLSGRAR